MVGEIPWNDPRETKADAAKPHPECVSAHVGYITGRGKVKGDVMYVVDSTSKHRGIHIPGTAWCTVTRERRVDLRSNLYSMIFPPFRHKHARSIVRTQCLGFPIATRGWYNRITNSMPPHRCNSFFTALLPPLSLSFLCVYAPPPHTNHLRAMKGYIRPSLPSP